MKILLVQQKMIGDVLVSSLLCEQLKKAHPDCELHYLINEHTLAVVENNPFIDTIVLFKKDAQQSKRKFFGFLKSISKEKYDVVIDIYGKLESNLISLFSGSPIKISHRKWYSNFIYTHTVSGTKNKDSELGLAIENRQSFIAPILKNDITETTAPKIYLTQTEINAAKSYLTKNDIALSKPIIMLGILGSGAQKTYPLPYMSKVIDAIASKTDATLLFNYIPSQLEEAKALYELCDEQSKSKIKFDVFAPSLRDFLALLYHCAAIIGNEGGAVNMAKALDVPTFSIYSPWINKLAWHTFNKNKQNVAVHLSDFMPDKFSSKSKKELKQHTEALYDLFKPSLFQDQITSFLGSKFISNE